MHINVDPEGLQDFLARGLQGPVDMLNLLRFRDVADYSAHPGLAPPAPISGREAYARYFAQAEPILAGLGAERVYDADGGTVIIGPTDGAWDRVLVIRWPSVDVFMELATHEGYRGVVGHRAAALRDSRLLPTQARG